MNKKYAVHILLIITSVILISLMLYNTGYANGYNEGWETRNYLYDSETNPRECTNLGICIGDTVELSNHANDVLPNGTQMRFDGNTTVTMIYGDGVVGVNIDGYGNYQISEYWLVVVPDVVNESEYDKLYWATDDGMKTVTCGDCYQGE